MTVETRPDSGGWGGKRPPPGLIRIPDGGELVSHPRVAWDLALRDVQLRYKQTLLGVAWTVIKPLVGVGLFTVVFGNLVGVPSGGKPYAVFVFAGLLGWNYFSSSLSSSATSLLDNQEMVTKI